MTAIDDRDEVISRHIYDTGDERVAVWKHYSSGSPFAARFFIRDEAARWSQSSSTRVMGHCPSLTRTTSPNKGRDTQGAEGQSQTRSCSGQQWEAQANTS